MPRLGENEKYIHCLERKLGYRGKCLEDNIKMDLRYVGLECTDWNLVQGWVFAFH
jgi:hypothetical protein